jgi:hypothetical protein
MSLSPANHYVLDGVVAGTVDTGGVGGKPVITVDFDGQPVQDAELERTPSGLQIIALLDARPDLDSRSLLILLPDVNIAEAPVAVAAVAAVVTARTSIGGPRLVQGPLQSYAVHPVAATASLVQSLS